MRVRALYVLTPATSTSAVLTGACRRHVPEIQSVDWLTLVARVYLLYLQAVGIVGSLEVFSGVEVLPGVECRTIAEAACLQQCWTRIH